MSTDRLPSFEPYKWTLSLSSLEAADWTEISVDHWSSPTDGHLDIRVLSGAMPLGLRASGHCLIPSASAVRLLCSRPSPSLPLHPPCALNACDLDPCSVPRRPLPSSRFPHQSFILPSPLCQFTSHVLY